MSTGSHGRAVDAAVFGTLRERQRRLALAVLGTRVYEVAVSDLATGMVARREDEPLLEVTAAEHDPVHAALRHRHLPRLAEVDLVEHDPAAGTVRALDHPALRDPGIQRALDAAPHAEAGSLDALFDALADDRRRLALSVLAEACRPLPVEALALRVVAREHDAAPDAVPDEAVASTAGRLAHAHLPKLRGAGLVAEADDGVAYDGHPSLRLQWLEAGAEA